MAEDWVESIEYFLLRGCTNFHRFVSDGMHARMNARRISLAVTVARDGACTMFSDGIEMIVRAARRGCIARYSRIEGRKVHNLRPGGSDRLQPCTAFNLRFFFSFCRLGRWGQLVETPGGSFCEDAVVNGGRIAPRRVSFHRVSRTVGGGRWKPE
jgi:hypothetical protein